MKLKPVRLLVKHGSLAISTYFFSFPKLKITVKEGEKTTKGETIKNDSFQQILEDSDDALVIESGRAEAGLTWVPTVAQPMGYQKDEGKELG